MKRFTGQIVVVTGAAQGIGRTTAELFAREGAKVALFDIQQEAVAGAAEALSSVGEVIGVVCDVSSRPSVEAAFAEVKDRLGPVSVLVNNAGVTRDALIHKMTDDLWQAVIDTHLKGAFLCSQAAQEQMVPAGYGRIVMLSSRAAQGNRGQSNYSAAKAGLQGLAKTLAIELGRFGITVNAVAPGHIDTAMTRAAAEKMGIPYEQMAERAITANAVKRVGTPEDVAEAIAYLASPQAGYVTGQTIYVAGRPTG